MLPNARCLYYITALEACLNMTVIRKTVFCCFPGTTHISDDLKRLLEVNIGHAQSRHRALGRI